MCVHESKTVLRCFEAKVGAPSYATLDANSAEELVDSLFVHKQEPQALCIPSMPCFRIISAPSPLWFRIGPGWGSKRFGPPDMPTGIKILSNQMNTQFSVGSSSGLT
jgi:hypothetical protein